MLSPYFLYTSHCSSGHADSLHVSLMTMVATVGLRLSDFLYRILPYSCFSGFRHEFEIPWFHAWVDWDSVIAMGHGHRGRQYTTRSAHRLLRALQLLFSRFLYLMEERLDLSAYHSCKSFVRWGIPVELAARGSGFLAHCVVMLHWARFLNLLFDGLTFYRGWDPHGSGSWIGSSSKVLGIIIMSELSQDKSHRSQDSAENGWIREAVMCRGKMDASVNPKKGRSQQSETGAKGNKISHCVSRQILPAAEHAHRLLKPPLKLCDSQFLTRRCT